MNLKHSCRQIHRNICDRISRPRSWALNYIRELWSCGVWPIRAPPLESLFAILCNSSSRYSSRARETGWKARVLRGSPIVSSLATINCQNVPHNSVRAQRPLSRSTRARPRRIYLSLTYSIDSRGEEEGREGPRGPNPSVNHLRYLRGNVAVGRDAADVLRECTRARSSLDAGNC